MTEAIYLTDRICPECGTVFAVLHPDLWAYKIKPHTLFCSWRCLRATQKRKEEKEMAKKTAEKEPVFRLTKEQVEKAVQIYYAESRKAAVAYIAKCGSRAPDKCWDNIRHRLQLKAPEKKVEVPEANKVETVETPEAPIQVIELKGIDTDIVKMNKELDFNDRCTVSAIRVENLGEFYSDRKFGVIDWRTEGGEEISLRPERWKQLTEDLQLILKRLGVEL